MNTTEIKTRIRYLSKLIKEAKAEQKRSKTNVYALWIDDAYEEIEALKSKVEGGEK